MSTDEKRSWAEARKAQIEEELAFNLHPYVAGTVKCEVYTSQRGLTKIRVLPIIEERDETGEGPVQSGP